MENTKKRHNPPIFEEDSAVKAFDRLESIVEKAKSSSEEVKVIETERSKRDEFYKLITLVFGEKFYQENKEDLGYFTGETDPKIINYYYTPEPKWLHTPPFTLHKSKKTKWYNKKRSEKYITLEIDTPKQLVKSDAIEVTKIEQIIHKEEYQPIEITAHTPEALKESKVFAKAYEELTGKKATVIKDCAETPVKDLEQVVKEKPNFKVEGLKRIGKKTFSMRNPVGNFFKGFGMMYFALPTAVRIYPTPASAASQKGLNAGITAGFVVTTFVMGIGYVVSLINFGAEGRLGEIIDKGYWMIPAAHLGSNLLSGGYEWWKHEAKQAEEEYDKGKK